MKTEYFLYSSTLPALIRDERASQAQEVRQEPQFEGSDKTIFWVKPSYYRRRAMTDARDNDTSVKKLPAEIPGEVRFLWSRLVTDRLKKTL